MLPRWRYIPAPASRFTTQTDTIRHRALWMTKRSGRVGAGVAIALSIAFPAAAQTGQSASGYKAPVISDTGRLQGPRQPIFFRHDIHAGQDQIACLYCHNTVTISSEPGIPAVQTCFGCHQIVTGGKRPFGGTVSAAQDSTARAAEAAEVPGIATYYATTCRECAAGCGLQAKVREGRVIKLEGNPESPINQGRLCSRGQAGLQGLYNPDRVTDPMARGPNGEWQKLSWEDAINRLQAKVKEARGKGIAFVTGLESGSFGELVDAWIKGLGGRHVTYEPFAFEALREGNRLAFGTSAIPWYDFANARYIVSFGADFMETWLSPVGYQNGFTRAHAFEGGRDGSMAKFVSVAPRLSLTGMSADEWIAAKPGTEYMLALAMAQVILAERLAPTPADARGLDRLLPAPQQVATFVGIEARDIRRLAREFAASQGGLAVAGGRSTHCGSGAQVLVASVNLLNYVAGRVGKTVKFGPNHALEAGGSFTQLTDLVGDMSAGKVALLLVHGANPAHSLPAAFSQALGRVAYKVSFSSYLDETAAASDLILPDLHPLEQWNDSRPRAGVYALQQPVMQPVFPNTRHTADVLLQDSGSAS